MAVSVKAITFNNILDCLQIRRGFYFVLFVCVRRTVWLGFSFACLDRRLLLIYSQWVLTKEGWRGFGFALLRCCPVSGIVRSLREDLFGGNCSVKDQTRLPASLTGSHLRFSRCHHNSSITDGNWCHTGDNLARLRCRLVTLCSLAQVTAFK